MNPISFYNIEQQILDFGNKVVNYSNNVKCENDMNELVSIYNRICCDVLYNDMMTENLKEFMFSVLYRFIFFTNDLKCSTSEKHRSYGTLSYKMTSVLYNINCSTDDFYKPLMQQLGKNALSEIITINLTENPNNCWEDVIKFCDYIHLDNTFFNYVIDIIVERLLIDSVKIKLGMEPSTLSFWLPKEKNKQYGYLTHHISYKLYPQWIKSAGTKSYSLYKAKRKCLTHYRNTINNLKTYLDIDMLKQYKYTQLPTIVNTNMKNKYNSYCYLLSDLCREDFIYKREEFSILWDKILYGDMPALTNYENKIDKDILDENEETIVDNEETIVDNEEPIVDNEDDIDYINDIDDTEPLQEKTGWFSRLFTGWRL